MNWRKRTVTDELKVEKITIYKFYKEQYKKDLFYVNRKYQRKLVWTLQEKKDLIDTIYRKYPIPMFLIASYIDSDSLLKWEIIDGLQRINAIVSFIDGDYAISFENNYGYFNLDAFTGYGKMASEGILTQNDPPLPLEICEKFLDYELSFSVTGKENSEVEEIFRRINSTGRKLSKQDLCQAGVTGFFSDLVRKTATYIRGDYTDNDLIKLIRITNYSLNNKDLPYGIDINTIFWIEQNIISEEGIRRSKDEEIVAHIYIYLLTKGNYSSSYSSLEKAYDDGQNLKKLLDETVYNEKNIINWMEIFAKSVYIINSSCKDMNFSLKLFGRNDVYNKDLCFVVVFCAIANLILDGMVLAYHEQFSASLIQLGNDNLQEISLKSNSKWNKDVRNRLIERIQNIFKPYFRYVPQNVKKYEEWDVKMINFLEHAETEEQMYDFKVGITDFKRNKFNKACISKIVETLTAMVNTKPLEEGYILLGIPNNDDDAFFISKKLNTTIEYCKNYKILGIKDEANLYYHDVDSYLKKIKDIIESEPISDSFKNEILTSCHPIEYKDKLLYMFVCSSSDPIYYDKKLYVRYGSHNHLVENGSDEFNTIMKKFYQV